MMLAYSVPAVTKKFWLCRHILPMFSPILQNDTTCSMIARTVICALRKEVQCVLTNAIPSWSAYVVLLRVLVPETLPCVLYAPARHLAGKLLVTCSADLAYLLQPAKAVGSGFRGNLDVTNESGDVVFACLVIITE